MRKRKRYSDSTVARVKELYYRDGKLVKNISKEMDIPYSNIYSWTVLDQRNMDTIDPNYIYVIEPKKSKVKPSGHRTFKMAIEALTDAMDVDRNDYYVASHNSKGRSTLYNSKGTKILGTITKVEIK